MPRGTGRGVNASTSARTNGHASSCGEGTRENLTSPESLTNARFVAPKLEQRAKSGLVEAGIDRRPPAMVDQDAHAGVRAPAAIGTSWSRSTWMLTNMSSASSLSTSGRASR